MTIALLGYGGQMSMETASGSGTFVAILEVNEIKPPSPKPSKIDATHFQSPNRTMEFISGLIDPGDMSFSFNFVPGGVADTAIRAWIASGDTRKLRITWVNGPTWTFSGTNGGYDINVPINDKMTATVTVTVTGSTVVA